MKYLHKYIVRLNIKIILSFLFCIISIGCRTITSKTESFDQKRASSSSQFEKAVFKNSFSEIKSAKFTKPSLLLTIYVSEKKYVTENREKYNQYTTINQRYVFFSNTEDVVTNFEDNPILAICVLPIAF
ncbi:MAG: hypothetical protein MK132_17710, partial [Lentisphaerales bacterium]|nr:hypothetical protein [Lentisphaerales bacterium]